MVLARRTLIPFVATVILAALSAAGGASGQGVKISPPHAFRHLTFKLQPGGIVQVEAAVYTPGTFRAVATYGSGKTYRAECAVPSPRVSRCLKLIPSAAARRQLRRRGTLRIEVSVVFTRPGGAVRSGSKTLVLKSNCSPRAAVVPSSSPAVKPGPSEFVAGFYLNGGPPHRAACDASAVSGPGTVAVINQATGVTVAFQTVREGHLVDIPLSAGTYRVAGTFLGAIQNNLHPTQTVTITMPGRETVRQNFVLQIP
jgi:hypothetical protein